MASTENSWRGQDQLLNIVVQAERPELAEEKVWLSIFFLGRFFGGKPDLPSGYVNSLRTWSHDHRNSGFTDLPIENGGSFHG